MISPSVPHGEWPLGCCWCCPSPVPPAPASAAGEVVTTPPTPTTSPTASTPPGIPVAPAASAAACNGAFEVDGWAVAPAFFLGAMNDGTVDEENDDEDDPRRTFLGFVQARRPYLARQRCRGKPRPPMGPSAPCGSAGGMSTLHKERRTSRSTAEITRAILPRFRPPRGVKPYSCFGGLMVDGGGKCSALARQGCLGTRAATCV